MITNNRTQIKTILENLQIDSLARQTGFSIRRSGKIDTLSFVEGFFQLMMNGKFSLRLWANNIAVLKGTLVSFQAVAKKLDYRQEPFFHALFQKALLAKVQQRLNFKIHTILHPFKRVILEDSTCFKLPKSLFEFFPGARLPHGRVASGRLQLRMDLKGNTYEAIKLQSYCQNDASFADDVLNSLQKGDLVVRDLGYWNIPVLDQIRSLGAYFLSRLHLTTGILSPENQLNIDLVNFLKQKERQGINHVDIPVLLSKKHRIPVRMVAIKLSDEQTQKRRRMSKDQRHKDIRISDKAFYLMSWNLFVTNVTSDIWDVRAVYHAYTLRWHIEMIFKGWKSKFNFNIFFKNCNGRNPVKPEIILLLMLTWLVLFYVQRFNEFAKLIWKNYQRILSPLRFADFFNLHFPLLTLLTNSIILPLLAYHCCYDKRKDRANHFEKTYINFLS